MQRQLIQNFPKQTQWQQQSQFDVTITNPLTNNTITNNTINNNLVNKNDKIYFRAKNAVPPVAIKEIKTKYPLPFWNDKDINDTQNLINEWMEPLEDELIGNDSDDSYKIESNESNFNDSDKIESNESISIDSDQIDSDESISIDSDIYEDDEIFGDECDLPPEELEILNIINAMAKRKKLPKSAQRQKIRKKKERKKEKLLLANKKKEKNL